MTESSSSSEFRTESQDDTAIDDDGTAVLEASDTPAAPSAAAWPWVAVARPAVIEVDGKPTLAAHRAAIDWAVATVAAAWRRQLERPLMIFGGANAKLSRLDPAFGVVITLDEPPVEALIVIDNQAARTLINAISAERAGVVAPNAPGVIPSVSSTEQGLMEFLFLYAADDVLKRAAISQPGPIVRSFLDGPQVEQWRKQHKQAAAAPLWVNLSAQQGMAAIYLDGVSEEQAKVLTEDVGTIGRTPPAPAELTVRLALPPVALTAEEFDAREPGDVLLLGVSDLPSIGAGCALVTSTDWVLAEARITEDTPTHVQVTLNPCDPAVRMAALHEPEEYVIQPMLGETKLGTPLLRGLKPKTPLQLPKAAAEPVVLYRGPRRVAAGELVILGSELGVRLTHCG